MAVLISAEYFGKNVQLYRVYNLELGWQSLPLEILLPCLFLQVALASFYENDGEDNAVEEEEAESHVEELPVQPLASHPKVQPQPKSGGVFSARYILISIY